MDKASRREKRDYFLAYAEDQKRVERDLKRMAELTRKLMLEINWGVRDDKERFDDVVEDEEPEPVELTPTPAFTSELLESNPTDFESRREFYVRAYDNPDKVIADLHYMAGRAKDLTERIDQGQHDRSFNDHEYVTLDVPPSEYGKLFSPVSGEVVPLWELDDSEFADGSCGDGLAILPTSGTLVAPATCRITAQLPSRNAIGLLTQDGIQVLIAVGSQAERYEGGGFRQHAWQNDTVRRGTPLISWNRRQVAQAGYNDVVVFVITNTEELEEVKVLKWGTVKAGDMVARVFW